MSDNEADYFYLFTFLVTNEQTAVVTTCVARNGKFFEKCPSHGTASSIRQGTRQTTSVWSQAAEEETVIQEEATCDNRDKAYQYRCAAGSGVWEQWCTQGGSDAVIAGIVPNC